MGVRSFLMFSGTFLVGSAAGFAVGYFVSKNKYRELADKEIESVRKAYEKHFKHNIPSIVSDTATKLEEKSIMEDKGVSKKNETIDPLTTSMEFVKLGDVVNEVNKKSTRYNKLYTGEGPHEEEIPQKIIKSSAPKKSTKKESYVITPDEFQESEYTAETLYWFSDKVLTDSDYNVIHDVVGLIGPEALNTFGRYLDDTVYVRNDSDKVDYEIIWDARKYSSMKPKIDDPTLSTEEDN